MNNILLLGGTGFVGRQICEQLVRAGLRVTVPTRREVNARAVQPLPGVTVLEADVHDEAELARLLPGHDAVVNLVGVLHGNQQRFERAHVELPRKLARAMQAAGIRRLVHVSALGASADGPSLYQRSKAAGEAALREAGLELTLLRPSVIFGAGDSFLTLFARLQAVLHAPSLYDEFLRHLHRRGYPVPAACVERDWSKPHVREPGLIPVFKRIYEDTDAHWEAYATCEQLVDVEAGFQFWRFRHLKTVERIIGYKPGTGGSSGVAFLKKALELSFFPELFAVRTRIG